MSVTVVWTPGAESELAKIWLNARDRQSVTESAHEIEQMLRIKPDSVGESRPKGRRILHIAPLGVVYTVLHGDQLVRVLSVWRFERR